MVHVSFSFSQKYVMIKHSEKVRCIKTTDTVKER